VTKSAATTAIASGATPLDADGTATGGAAGTEGFGTTRSGTSRSAGPGRSRTGDRVTCRWCAGTRAERAVAAARRRTGGLTAGGCDGAASARTLDVGTGTGTVAGAGAGAGAGAAGITRRTVGGRLARVAARCSRAAGFAGRGAAEGGAGGAAAAGAATGGGGGAGAAAGGTAPGPVGDGAGPAPGSGEGPEWPSGACPSGGDGPLPSANPGVQMTPSARTERRAAIAILIVPFPAISTRRYGASVGGVYAPNG
jgi:hypothetical protein